MCVARRENIGETTYRVHHRGGRGTRNGGTARQRAVPGCRRENRPCDGLPAGRSARRVRAWLSQLPAPALLGVLGLLAAPAAAQDKPTVTLSTSATTVQESVGDITLTATMTKTLTVAVPVGLSTVPGGTSAAPTDDFVYRSGDSPFATIAAGDTMATGTIGIIDDTRHEGDETITWELSLPTSVSSGGTLSITIEDNDPLAYAVSAATASEGGTATLTVRLSGSDESKAPSAGGTFTITTGFETGTGKAVAEDVGTVPTSVTFAAGAKTATFDIPILQDRIDEDDETFTVTVAPGNGFNGNWTPATTGANKATVTITDDDTAGVEVAGGPLSVYEGGETATYTVALLSQPLADVTITPTSGDAAKAAVSPAALTFAASDWNTAQTVTVTGGSVTGSTAGTVTISHAAGGTDAKYPSTMSIGEVAVTVVPLVFSLAQTASEGEGESAQLTVTLSPAAPTDVQFSVTPTYESGAGKAVAADLGSVPQTITVPQGSTSATLSIPLARDADEEVDETFTVAIAARYWDKTSTGADTATVTIQDTTEEMRIATPPPVRVTEGDTATLQVTRTGITTRVVPFTVSLHQRSSVPNRLGEFPIGPRIAGGEDFPAATVAGSFAVGASSAMVSLATVEDDVHEDTEGYSAVLTAAASTGYRSKIAHDAQSGVVLILVADDDPADDDTVEVSPTSLSALTGNTSTDGTTFGGTLTLSPAFASDTTSYAATVANSVTHVKLTPTANPSHKRVQVRRGAGTWATVTSGNQSNAFALTAGQNAFSISVEAEDRSTRVYTVTITRQSPAGAPTNLRVTAGDRKLDLTWTAPSGATVTGYDVHYTSSNAVAAGAAAGSNPAMEWVAVSRSGAATTQPITGLTNNKPYRVRVRVQGGTGGWLHGMGTPRVAVNSKAQWARSSVTVEETNADQELVLTILLTTPLKGTASLHVSQTGGDAVQNADWTFAVGKPCGTGFAGAASLSCTLDIKGDHLVEPAETIRLTLDFRFGPVSPGAEKTITVTIEDDDYDPPSAVGGLDVVLGGSNRLDLAWTAPPGPVTGFDVHYTSSATVAADVAALGTGADPATAWVDANHDGATASHAIRNLPGGKRYWMRVRAVNSAGAGPWVSSSVLLAPPPALPAPPGQFALRVTEGAGRLDLAWDAPAGVVAGYDVHYTTSLRFVQDEATGADPSRSWVDANHSGVTTSHALPGLAGDEEYQVRVRAVNGAGAGPWTSNVYRTLPSSPTVSLSAAPNPVTEGSPVTVTAELSLALSSDVTIPVTLTSDGAETDDYGTLSGIAITAGATSGTGTITTAQDTDEDDEVFTVALDTANLPSSVRPGRSSAVVVTIADDDGPPTALTLRADPAPAEGGDDVTVTAELDAPAPQGGTTVTLSLSGTASRAGEEADYTLSPETIEIAAGESEGTATIEIVDDTFDDPGETIVIDARSDSPVLTAERLTLNIADNDAPPTSLTLAVDLPAPAEDAGAVTVTATLDTPALTGGTTVTLTLTGTAEGPGDDADYTLSSATIEIDAGATSGTATITIVDDAVDEDGETIVIDARSDSPALTASTVTVTITDNDATLTGLTLSAGELSFTSDTTDYAVEVPNDVESVSVTPTAAAGATVTVNGASVASGASSADIPLDIGETTITIVATPANGAASLTYLVTITRVALPAELTLNADTTPAEGGGPVTVTATLDVPAPTGGTTVTLAATGTATGTGDEADYTLSSNTIAIAEGETEGTATIAIVDDAADDPDETIVLDAESDTPVLTAETLTLTIADNDAESATALTLRADAQPAEGAAPVTVTAVLNGPAPAGGTTVTLTATGTAAGTGDEADYTLSSTTIAIAAGETSGAATLTIIDDTADDDGETIILSGTSSNPPLTAPPLTLTIADNDEPPQRPELSCKPKPGVPAGRVTADGRSVALAAAALGGSERGRVNIEAELALEENRTGNGQAVVVGCVAVAAGERVYDRYAIVAGGGGFDVDTSGTLSYVGGGENHEHTAERVLVVNASRAGTTEAVVRVRVAITDANDAGVVTLSTATPQVGEPLTARVSDEDAERAQLGAAQWQWWAGGGGGGWQPIAGATGASYTPGTGDAGRVLQARATYADRHGRQHAASEATTLVALDAGGARLLQVGLAGWGRTGAAVAVDLIGRRLTPAALASGDTDGHSQAALNLNGRALLLPEAGDTAAQARLLHATSEALGVRVTGGDEVAFTPPTGAALLSGSAFSVHGGGGAWGLWGAGDLSGFAGKVDGIEQDGGLLSAYLGADYRLAANALAGLAAGYGSLDLTAKSTAVNEGKVMGWLVQVYPYGYWQPEPWLGLWAFAGVGMGRASLTLDDADPLEGGVRAWLGAAGQRVELLGGGSWSVAAKTDGFVTGLTTTEELPALSAHAWRGRVLLEVGAELRPPESVLAGRVEFGGRLDGGDVERGMGAEAGAQLSYRHIGLGLGLSGRGRLLLVHADAGLRDWGANVVLSWAPEGAGTGLALSVAPQWGTPASGVAELWQYQQGSFAGAEPAGTAWLPDTTAVRLSYGLAAPQWVIQPYAEVGVSGTRANYRLGVEGTLEY